MDWKNFFKPTVWKMVPFLALFLIYNSILGTMMCMSISYGAASGCHFGLEAAYGMYASILLTILDTIKHGIGTFAYTLAFGILLFIIIVIIPMSIVYALICAIAYAVGIVKKRMTQKQGKAKK